MEKKKCIKVYVSGKITGLEYSVAKHNFVVGSVQVREYFIKKGYEQVAIFNPMQKPGIHQGVSYEDCMEIDFMYINKCDAIYLMKGWEDSKGAQMEKKYAQFMNKVVYQEIHGEICRLI
ncbi:MAG: DUF4406 domain-containing protein [Candidatus Thorarchaeota archaeon]|nr:DUF4406 domain-containing protein [Candidatus Thorarchaeota archaeon]